MTLHLSTPHARWLFLVPVGFLACSGSGMSTTSTTATGSTTSTTSTSTTGSQGGGGGATSSTTSSSGGGGAGGATTTSSAGGGGATSSSGGGGAGGVGPSGTRVRIVAANLTSGNVQSYDPGEGIRILQGLHADVILLQEMNYVLNTEQDLRDLVDQICGMDCDFVRGGGQIPNAVVSRYPLLDAGTWPDPKANNRDFAWARVDVPGATDLWAVSVHLLTSSESERDQEAAMLVQQFNDVVSDLDYLVLGGDFNTHVRDEPALGTLSARLSIAPPYPADNDGNDNTNGVRTKPYDWVLPSPALRDLEVPVLIGDSQFDTGLVVDTRVYSPLDEISPAKDGDSGASNMQHMAVVRDFAFE
ncbi:MAG: endonuclease/exonuclease/phosphatase family protein [Minicystis sp.]